MRRLGNQLLELEFVLQLLSSSILSQLYLAVFLFPVARLCLPASKCVCKAEDRWKDLTRYSSGQQNKPLAKVIYLSICFFNYFTFKYFSSASWFVLYCSRPGSRLRVFFLVYCVTDGSRAIFGMGRTRLMPRRCKQYAYSCSAGTDNFLLELTRTAS